MAIQLHPRLTALAATWLLVTGCAAGASPSVPAASLAAPGTDARPPASASQAAAVDSTPASPAPATAGPPSAPASASARAASQTETEWGRIWDVLPADFPTPPGASPAEADEPVTAVLDLPLGVAEARDFMQAALERATFSTLALSGPLEDGSVVIDSVGAPSSECRIETTLTPAGGLTRMTVRYGAACPAP